MKKNKDRHLAASFGLFLLFTILTSCMKDDGYNCRITGYRLVIETDGQDMKSNENIHDIFLFLFDENGQFLDGKAVALDQVIELSYPGHRKLYAVAWGNIQGQNQTISPAQQGLKLSEASLYLDDNPARAQSNFVSSPNELFQGIKEIDTKMDTRNQPDVLIIKRKISAITIIAKYLKEYAESVATSSEADDPFSYEVRSSKNALNFYGQLIGEDKNYLPACAFNTNNELVAPPFFVLPTEEGKNIEVDIYRGTELIYTVKNDQNGLLIRADEGKLLTLIIDFSTNADVNISIEDWDKIDITEDF